MWSMPPLWKRLALGLPIAALSVFVFHLGISAIVTQHTDMLATGRHRIGGNDGSRAVGNGVAAVAVATFQALLALFIIFFPWFVNKIGRKQ